MIDMYSSLFLLFIFLSYSFYLYFFIAKLIEVIIQIILVLLTWLLLDDNIILYIDDGLGRYLKKNQPTYDLFFITSIAYKLIYFESILELLIYHVYYL